ncbi:hypothetical protein BCR44DRAFT_1428010 [Catenaria anguillulae PL171]|uniref:Ubiquitin carboxyl-terminal hydrolase n=1 Tax=Catenaria anguillulae PL171 TaxID=765915 RepID=A0A1Y2HWK4_9FUNG|nr:hypothetical protein BCR44DRAFT_1428010 [Catenaria anguillulae PL171]
MGGKARAAAKKAEREAEKKQARKRTEEALKATATSTITSTSATPSPSNDSEFASASNKKCPHVKSGIKLKKLTTAACAAFSGSPAACGESSCRSSRSGSTPLWFCLCCMRLVCQPDLGAHDHPTFLSFPLSSRTTSYSSADLEAAIESGTLRFACTDCAVELATPKNPLLLDALSAVRKRLEAVSISDAVTSNKSGHVRDFSPFDAAPFPSAPSSSFGSSKRAPVLKPNDYLALGVHGLTNLGNTCYAAALLQCLAHARHLAVPSAADCDDMDLLSSAFYAFLRDMHISVGSPTLHPGGVLSELGRRFREFRSFSRQNDSHEMMRCLVDVIDTEHGKRVKAQREEAGQDNEGEDRECETEDVEQSPVAQAFRSELLSCIKCLSCGKVQTVPEPFFDFSLVMSASLGSSLAQFFAEDQVLYSCEEESCPSRQSPVAVQEKVEPHEPDANDPDASANESDVDEDDSEGEGDPWAGDDDKDAETGADANGVLTDPASDTDDEGDTKRPSPKPKPSTPPTAHSKRYMIKSLAPTLCFQLKRTARSKKAKLDFPTYLSLRESDPDSDTRPDPAHYELFGVVEHTGSMSFGHYTAYVKVHQPPIALEVRGTSGAYPVVSRENEGQSAAVWVHANDARVTRVSEAEAVHSNPYLLFYQRVRKE